MKYCVNMETETSFQVPGSDRPYSEMWVEGGGDADSLPPLTLFLHKEHYQSLQPVAGLMVQDTVDRKQLTRSRVPLFTHF